MKKTFTYRGWHIDVVPCTQNSGSDLGFFRGQCGDTTWHTNRLKANALEEMIDFIDEREDAPKACRCATVEGAECYFVRGHGEDGLQTEAAHCCHCGRAYEDRGK